MPRLTIIIPWVGPLESFEETLAAVLQNRPQGCEILVALSAPYNDPHGLGEEVNFLPRLATNSMAALVNAALRHVSSPVLQIIPCGYVVEESWASAPLLQFDDAQVAAVAPVLQNVTQRDKVLAAGIQYVPGGSRQLSQAGQRYELSSLVQSRPQGATLAGGFFRTSVLNALGGFDASLGDDMADVDFALCLAQLDLRTECEPASVLLQTSAAPSARGTFAQGKAAEVLLRRHASLWEPSESRGHHRGQVLRELLRSLVQPWWLAHLAGRAIGLISSRFDRAHAARLTQARDQLTAATSSPDVLPMPSRTLPSTHRRAA